MALVAGATMAVREAMKEEKKRWTPPSPAKAVDKGRIATAITEFYTKNPPPTDVGSFARKYNFYLPSSLKEDKRAKLEKRIRKELKPLPADDMIVAVAEISLLGGYEWIIFSDGGLYWTTTNKADNLRQIDGYKWGELAQSTLSEGKKFAALAIREGLIRFDGPGVELWCYSKLSVETVIKHLQALIAAIMQ